MSRARYFYELACDALVILIAILCNLVAFSFIAIMILAPVLIAIDTKEELNATFVAVSMIWSSIWTWFFFGNKSRR